MFFLDWGIDSWVSLALQVHVDSEAGEELQEWGVLQLLEIVSGQGSYDEWGLHVLGVASCLVVLGGSSDVAELELSAK